MALRLFKHLINCETYAVIINNTPFCMNLKLTYFCSERHQQKKTRVITRQTLVNVHGAGYFNYQTTQVQSEISLNTYFFYSFLLIEQYFFYRLHDFFTVCASLNIYICNTVKCVCFIYVLCTQHKLMFRNTVCSLLK